MKRGLGRHFWLLFGGESTSALGTAASAVALPVVTLQLSGDVRQAGLAGTALSVGVVLARLPGGVIADRYERRALLLAGNLTGAAVLGTLVLLLARGAASLPLLLAAALLLGVIASTLVPAESVAVRTLVPSQLLPRALTLLQTRMAAAMIAGPLVGGALLTLSPEWVFGADAATYLVSVCCMALLPSGPRPAAAAQPPLRAAVEGLRFIWDSAFLRYTAVNATVLNLVFNGLLIVVIAAAGSHGGSIGIGVQIAALGAGALVGSLLAAPVAERLPPARGVAGATGVVALALLGFAVVRTGWAAAALLALAAAAGPVITVVTSTVQIRITPAELQGRVLSGIGFLAQAVSPLGPVLAGLSAHAVGFTPTVVGAAFVVVLLALVGALVTTRPARTPGPGNATATTDADTPLQDAVDGPADPYRWLEQTDGPRTRAWLADQQRLLHGAAGLTEDPAWGRVLARIDRSATGRLLTPPTEVGGALFQHERLDDGELLAVLDPNGSRRVLLSCGTDASGRIAGWQPSPTGDRLAVQLHLHGRENGGLHLLPVRPGPAPEQLGDAAPHGSPVFLGDWLLYSAGTRTEHTLSARHLHDGTTRSVALPVDGPVRLSLHSGPGSHLLLRTRTPDGAATRWWVTDWTGRTAPDWQPVDLDGLRVTALELRDDICYLAARQIFALDLRKIARGDTAPPVPLPLAGAAGSTGEASAIRALRVFGPAADLRLAVLRQTGTTRRLEIRPADSTDPDAGSDLSWHARLRLGTVSRDRGGAAGNALWLLADDPLSGGWSRRLSSDSEIPLPARGTSLRTLTAISRDGTAVPVTLCDPDPATRHEPAPVLVTVYGGFGIPLEPTWDPMLAAWLHAGGRAAWVHARGGSEFGPAWAEAGRGPGKSSTVDDLCAAAAALVDRQEAGPGRLAVLAASNGGLVAAAALTRAPHLFAAVVCAAPLTDMARYHVGGLGRLWREEYGDPDQPDALGALLAYSPYHRVTAGTDYPAVLLVTGGNDERVPPWHAWKLCAALQDATSGTAPILLDHHEGSGHQGPSSTEARALGTRILTLLGARTGLRPPI